MAASTIGRLTPLLLLIAPILAADYPVLTVCGVLSDLSFYNGKTIIVVGKHVQTMEGSSLAQECPTKPVTDGYEWSNVLSLERRPGLNRTRAPSLPGGFNWNEDVVTKKLDEVKNTTTLSGVWNHVYRDRWAAIFGRLETTIPLRLVVDRKGQRSPNGFSHDGSAPAQLVWPGNGIHYFASPPPGRIRKDDLWQMMKVVLSTPDGEMYFNNVVKGVLIHGAGSTRFRPLCGTVISRSPESWPTVFVLGLSDATTPEVTLKLDKPWKIDVPPGSKIEFEGVAVAYTRSPLMVTFAAATTQLSIAARR